MAAFSVFKGILLKFHLHNINQNSKNPRFPCIRKQTDEQSPPIRHSPNKLPNALSGASVLPITERNRDVRLWWKWWKLQQFSCVWKVKFFIPKWHRWTPKMIHSGCGGSKETPAALSSGQFYGAVLSGVLEVYVRACSSQQCCRLPDILPIFSGNQLELVTQASVACS